MVKGTENGAAASVAQAFDEILAQSRKVYEAGLDHLGHVSEVITKAALTEQAQAVNYAASHAQTLAALAASITPGQIGDGREFVAKALDQQKQALQDLTDYALGVQSRQIAVINELWSSATKALALRENLGRSLERYGAAVLDWPRGVVVGSAE